MRSKEKNIHNADLGATVLDNNPPEVNSPPKEKLEIPFKRQIVWKNVAVYIIAHALLPYGLYYLFFVGSWGLFIYYWVLHIVIAQSLLMGAHRLYSHRSFKASKTLEIALIALQTSSSQNSIWEWARDHRQHHKYSDTDADPHNANNGFFFSHVGWLLSKKHPEVIEKGKGIDVSDLDSNPYVMFQKRHYIKLLFLFGIVIPALFPVFVLGEPWLYSILVCDLTRIVVHLNCTWLVNSWAHFFGTKPFDKNMRPVETVLVSAITCGEGWHNYHHCFPMDYKASEYGAPFNLTAAYIRMFERLGLAWDLKEASTDAVVKRAQRTGDETPLRMLKPTKTSMTKKGIQRITVIVILVLVQLCWLAVKTSG